MKKILFLLMLTASALSYGQHDEAYVNALVAQKMAELEMQDNPAYFYKKDYCLGHIQMFMLPNGERCTSESTYYAVYVFWQKEDKQWGLQKFDNCGTFRPFTVDFGKDIEKALKNRDALITDEVKPYKGEQIDDNAFGNMKVQACRKEYQFVFGGTSFEKSFKEFDLSNDSKYKNVNAQYNNNLPLVKLDAALSEMIKSLEEGGKFFREK